VKIRRNNSEKALYEQQYSGVQLNNNI